MGISNEGNHTEWQPGSLFRKHASKNDGVPSSGSGARFGLIILNQPLGHFAALRRLWENAHTHVAADGGANCLYEAGASHGDNSFDDLQTIIGDLDSLRDDVRLYFESRPSQTKVIHDPDQYSTDFGKAVRHVRKDHAGPVDIVAIGGLGGRVDQGLSQIHHLYLFQKEAGYRQGRVYLVSEESITFLLKSGSHRIRIRDGEEDIFGKHVGIIPAREPSKITTKGLEWDVEDWETEFGGQMSTSNHVLPETEVVEVHTTKDVIFTIAVKQPRSSAAGREL